MGGCTFLDELAEEPAYLYHGTTASNLESLLDTEFLAPSYWSRSYEMAVYYAIAAAEEEGQGDAVVLRVPWARFQEAKFKPDWVAAAEPITTILGPQEEEIFGFWQMAKGTWQDSLAILDSVIYEGEGLRIGEEEVYEVEKASTLDLEYNQWIRDRLVWRKTRRGKVVGTR